MKYRDRAKERREGLIVSDEEMEDIDGENLVIREGDEEIYTKTKGLDLDLLRREREKEMKTQAQSAIASLDKLLSGIKVNSMEYLFENRSSRRKKARS